MMFSPIVPICINRLYYINNQMISLMIFVALSQYFTEIWLRFRRLYCVPCMCCTSERIVLTYSSLNTDTFLRRKKLFSTLYVITYWSFTCQFYSCGKNKHES